MKNAIISIIAISLIQSVGLAASKDAPSPEMLAKREKARETFMRASGGIILNKATAVGYLAVINAQKMIPEEEIEKQSARIEDALGISIKCSMAEKPVDFNSLDATIAKAKGNVNVIILENATFPAIVSVPEKKAVIVNITALSCDNPGQDKILDRTRKEMCRAVCFAFHIGYSSVPGSIMDPVFSLQELDGILVDNLAVAQKMTIERSAAQNFGIKGYKRATYFKACQEGWAPPPKNAFQSNIWDKVHSIPTKPIKIEFDPKTDTK